MTNYKGWTNYATWCVNLEIFDGIDPSEMGWHKLDKWDFADALQSQAYELIEMDGKGLALDYALAFLSDVNWQEIAKHQMADYADDETETETDEVEA